MQEPDDTEGPSKTQRKKEMLALQDIGKILVELPAPQLAKIPLPDNLAQAVQEARRLKTHESRRRALQFIGKIMRHIETGPIQEEIDKIQSKNLRSKVAFHLVERWRDKLLSDDEKMLENFIREYPHTDTQKLRQILRKHNKKAELAPGADTALFRYLRTIIEE